MFNFPTKTATEVIINTIVDFFNLWPKTPVIRHMYLVDVQPDPFDYYVRILKKNNGIRDVSNEDQEVISLETQNVSSRMSGEQKRKNIQLKIEFKDISKVEADVIVNSVSSNLNLSIGGVSSTLSGAEPLLQGECRSKYPNGIKEGHVAVTSGGQLKCKSIYHACLPSYENEESIKHLSEMITKCLEMAVKGEYSSIAFPALGTGMLCYPKKIVTSTFHQCINEFSFQSESINKFDIMIVLRPEEADSFKEYLKEVKRKDEAEKKTCQGRDKFVDVCFYSDDKFRLEGAVELFFAEYAKEIGN